MYTDRALMGFDLSASAGVQSFGSGNYPRMHIYHFYYVTKHTS